MKPRLTVLATMALISGAAGMASASDDLTSLSYISYLERYATVKPAQGGETLDAVVNMPVLAGDRIDTARGARVEVQLADGSTVWIDEFTTVDFDALAYSRDNPAPRTVLYLDNDGSVAVEIPSAALGDGTMRVDTPRGTLYLNRPGLYRVDLHSGQLHVEARSGLAELPSGSDMGSTMLRSGQEAWIDQAGNVNSNVLTGSPDDFWSWVEDRRHPGAGSLTAQYVGSEAGARAWSLDTYGDWVYVPTFSAYMWRPHVALGWTPYSEGRWVWTPVGWTWVSYEPWGWYPYHYGSWYLDASFGWVWGFDSGWGPAWVDWFYTPGYVGWCPRGYYDWWYLHNNPGTWGGGRPGYRNPARWADVTLDFSGRVRLREVDPRPWTIVPSDQFANSHLVRARVDATRFLRDLPSDRFADVRSGPLLTPPPRGGTPDRLLDSALRPQTGERNVPDISSIFRRETAGDRPVAELPVRPVRTAQVMQGLRPIVPAGGGNGPGEQLGPDRSARRQVWQRPSSGVTRDSYQPAESPVTRRDASQERVAVPDRARESTPRQTVTQPDRGPAGSQIRPPERSVPNRGGDRPAGPPTRQAPSAPREPVHPSGGDSSSRSSPPRAEPPRQESYVEMRERIYSQPNAAARTWSRDRATSAAPMTDYRPAGRASAPVERVWRAPAEPAPRSWVRPQAPEVRSWSAPRAAAPAPQAYRAAPSAPRYSAPARASGGGGGRSSGGGRRR